MKTSNQIFVVTLLALALAGCGTTRLIEGTQATTNAAAASFKDAVSQIEARKADTPLYERVNGLWLSSRALPKTTGMQLPVGFTKQFVLRDQLTMSIPDLADAIRTNTSINVLVHGDSVGLLSRRYSMDHVGTLAALLDSTAARTGITWEFKDNAIQIQQSVAKTFVLDRAGIDAVKLAGAASGSSSGGTGLNVWTELSAGITTVAQDPDLKITLMRSSNAITVVGTPAAVARITEFLAIDDGQAGKQMAVVWKLVSFTTKDGATAGLSLDYVLARNGGKFSVSSPGSLAGANAGAVQLSSTVGNAKGTSALLEMLNELGSTTVVRQGVSYLKNNGRQDFGTEKEIFYLSESTAGVASSVAGTGGVGIKQASVKVGLSGVFGGTIFNSERMELSYDFSISVLDQLKSVTSAGQTLQSPETTKRFARGSIVARHGETWVMAAESADTDSFDRRGLLPGSAAVLGGSETAAHNKDQFLLVVTPLITQKGIN
jgi:hypothetical protein